MDDWHPKHDEHVEQPPPWLMTFADVTALMLTFFVMLFAMSQVQSEKWDAIIALLSTSDNARKVDNPSPQAEENIGTTRLAPALPLDYLAQVLEEKLKRDAVLKDARIHQLDRQLVVSLPSELLFRPGRAELQPAAREALFRMGGVVSTIGNRIDVHGHTDPDPHADSAYPSKWALSLARAAAVANELKRTGYVRDVIMLGLADSRYHHLSAALPEAQRKALARRVDLVIHPDAGES